MTKTVINCIFKVFHFRGRGSKWTSMYGWRLQSGINHQKKCQADWLLVRRSTRRGLANGINSFWAGLLFYPMASDYYKPNTQNWRIFTGFKLKTATLSSSCTRPPSKGLGFLVFAIWRWESSSIMRRNSWRRSISWSGKEREVTEKMMSYVATTSPTEMITRSSTSHFSSFDQYFVFIFFRWRVCFLLGW